MTPVYMNSMTVQPNSLFSLHPRARSWVADLNDGVTPDHVRCNNQQRKFWFKCDVCDHVFDTILSSIYKGSWCPFCANKRLCTDDCNLCFSKSFASTDKAKFWSPQNIDKPRDIFINCNKNKKFICINDHAFEMKPNNIANGKWCTLCGRKSASDKQRMKLPVFLDRATSIHGNMYDYTEVDLVNVDTVVRIKCKIHGIFEQTPWRHLTGMGCPSCGIKKRAEKHRFTQEEYIALARKVHGTKYKYDKTVYTRQGEKVVITCPNHGDFEQSSHSHISGCGCPLCAIEKTAIKNRMTQQQYIDQCIAMHGDKYDYSTIVYVSGKEKVNIICKTHGLFEQTAHNHMYGFGCKRCAPKRHSGVALEWLRFCEMYYNIDIQHAANGGEYTIPGTRYAADGYSQSGCIFEFNGDYWHGNPSKFESSAIFPHNTSMTYGDLYQKTLKKKQTLEDAGFTVISIWESDWRKGVNAVIALQKLFKKT